MIILAAYAPYAWIILEPYPWNDYRWFWVRISPLMPTMALGTFLGFSLGLRDDSERLLLSAVLLLLIGPVVLWLGTRSRLAFAVTLALVLLASALCSVATRGFFLM